MKLLEFRHLEGYRFSLTFEEGSFPNSDLEELIGEKVGSESLDSARIDREWGCLEFEEGKIDIEPQTLLNFCQRQALGGGDSLLMRVAEEPVRYETGNQQ